MAVFAYKAIDPTRSAVRGVIAADGPRQARHTLRERGLMVQEVVPSGGTSRGPGRWFAYRHRAEVAAIIRELSTLLGAGIPLLEALDTISRQHHGSLLTTLTTLRDRVASGASLADAMRDQPALFDDLSVNVVEVGEQAGSLDVVLDRLGEFKERSLRFKNKVATALAYPVFVLVMALSVAVGLMTLVIPKLLETLVESGRPLPLATQVVKGASDLLLHRWWALLGAAALVAACVALPLRRPAWRLRWHRAQLRIPVLGPMIRKQEIARVAAVIATMMKSGITFLRAVEIARRGVRNLAVSDALARCEAAVSAGRDISTALESTGIFPPVVVQVFSVGQQSGRLEEMLERLAADYDQQVSLASDRLTAVLEPLLILMLVGVVALIAFATILPLLEAADVS